MTANSPYSIRSNLPHEIRDIDGRLETYLKDRQELKAPGVPGFAMKMISNHAIHAARDALDIDVLSELARCWSVAIELRQVGRESREQPDKETTIYFDRHKVMSAMHPEVEVLGPVCFRISGRFTLELSVEIRTASIKVKNGYVIEVGRCEAAFGCVLKFDEYPLHTPLKPRPIGLVEPHKLASPGWEVGRG
jgi:hypothetical protein